jgi:dihydrofolate reductase
MRRRCLVLTPVTLLGPAAAVPAGRVTYEEMAKFWPSSDHPIAAPMNEIPKVVFSASLQSATWPPTRIARGDTAEELARLKQEPGVEIIAHGGTKFARSLIRLGMVDE